MPTLGIDIWFLAKGFVLLGLLVYLAFAAVLVRQVMLMTQTIKVSFEQPIRFFSFAHFFLAILVFLLALLFL